VLIEILIKLWCFLSLYRNMDLKEEMPAGSSKVEDPEDDNGT
jgi:hypothetical protein